MGCHGLYLDSQDVFFSEDKVVFCFVLFCFQPVGGKTSC